MRFLVTTEVQMKKSFLAAGFVLSALLLFSCATTKKSETKIPASASSTDIAQELPFVSKPCIDNEIINTYQ